MPAQVTTPRLCSKSTIEERHKISQGGETDQEEEQAVTHEVVQEISRRTGYGDYQVPQTVLYLYHDTFLTKGKGKSRRSFCLLLPDVTLTQLRRFHSTSDFSGSCSEEGRVVAGTGQARLPQNGQNCRASTRNPVADQLP